MMKSDVNLAQAFHAGKAFCQFMPKNAQNLLTPETRLHYIAPAFAKSKAERRNSNCLTLADNSTPSACFFIRCFRTPIKLDLAHARLAPMVACSGKGSPFAVFQCLQFSTPLHVTAKSVETFAVTSKNLTLELSAMLFKFLLLGETKRLTLSIRANSEQEARQRIRHSSPMVFVARINLGGALC